MTTQPSLRLYRLLLHLYPQSFREAYGSGMTDMFSLRLAETSGTRSRIATAWLVTRELSGLAAGAVRQRGAGRKRSRAERSQSPHNVHFTRQAKREGAFQMLHEVRLAVRRLAKAPGFTSAAILTLGLGIGANSAIFSLVHGIVLRPLPYPDSDRVVRIHHSAPGIGLTEGLELTRGLYVFYRERGRMLEEVAVYRTNELTITGDGEPARVPAARATYTLRGVLKETWIWENVGLRRTGTSARVKTRFAG